MNKRLLVISDIHGEYDMFVRLLDKVKYNPQTCQLMLLGDFVDKGPKSREVIELVMKLVAGGAKASLGNHELSFLRWLQGDRSRFHSSTSSTFRSYVYTSGNARRKYTRFELDEGRRYILKRYKHHVNFLKSLPYYFEDDEHVYVHAGFDSSSDDWRKNTKTDDFVWIRERFYNNPTNEEKITVFGHTKCRRLHDSDDPWFDGDKIGIDGGASEQGQLNCLEILGNKEYRIHKVFARNVRGGNQTYGKQAM
ncbi:putative metallophosphoesterase [Bacillus phage SP-15]|uniref:Putative metallophosphoesterase n=1 Tax=Bacillus phage SP-15 TaxID=1792032 RepID=A0A127AVW0_9CAUD|nr:NinI-like serine-threonine phosphatase [Bacillus phage SP-15]AMM44799.1 putative metallophosphoesterase [Bacillus phage SP-15]